jgi:hypothetical protein
LPLLCLPLYLGDLQFLLRGKLIPYLPVIFFRSWRWAHLASIKKWPPLVHNLGTSGVILQVKMIVKAAVIHCLHQVIVEINTIKQLKVSPW